MTGWNSSEKGPNEEGPKQAARKWAKNNSCQNGFAYKSYAKIIRIFKFLIFLLIPGRLIALSHRTALAYRVYGS